MGSDGSICHQEERRLSKLWRRVLFFYATATVSCAVLLLLLNFPYWFSQVPNTSPFVPPVNQDLGGRPPFSFAVVGDSRRNMGAFEAILKSIKKENPAAILFTGDIVARCTRPNFKWVVHELREEQLPMPFFAVPGNHDVDKHVDPQKPDERCRLYTEFFGPRRYWFGYANTLFVAFDNSAIRFAPDDLLWLDATLTRLRDRYKLCFVYMHVPPFNPLFSPKTPKTEGAKAFVRIVKRHNVSAVFASHIHTFLHDETLGFPLFISGGGGARPQSWCPPSPFHYLLCSVSEDGTFVVKKRDVSSSDYDYFEYLLCARFRPSAVVGTLVLWLLSGLLAGTLCLVSNRQCEHAQP